MKIIITENQYKILENHTKDYEGAKKLLFKFWQNEIDETGKIDFDIKIGNYINYKSIGAIHEMYRDFLGGWDKMVKKSFELMDRTFDTRNYDFSGGYDFRFEVNDGNNEYEEDNEIFVDCPIESDGEVTLMTDGNTYLLNNLEDSDFWWEIESEISSVIEDILYEEVTKKTGILIKVNNFWIK